MVGIPAADAELDLLKGSWRQVTPEELSHSLIFMLSERCQQAPEEELWRWKNIVLSIPVMFVVLDGEDSLYWEAHNQRQRTMG